MGDIFLIVIAIGMFVYYIVDRICEYLEKRNKNEEK